MANGEENNTQQTEFWKGIEQLLKDQTDIIQGIDQEGNRVVNKNVLLEALENLKAEEDDPNASQELEKINSSIKQLNAYQQESINPDIYREIFEDLFSTLGDKQVSALKDAISDFGSSLDRQEVITKLESVKNRIQETSSSQELEKINSAIQQLNSYQEGNITKYAIQDVFDELITNLNSNQSNIIEEFISQETVNKDAIIAKLEGVKSEIQQSGYENINNDLSNINSAIQELNSYQEENITKNAIQDVFDELTTNLSSNQSNIIEEFISQETVNKDAIITKLESLKSEMRETSSSQELEKINSAIQQLNSYQEGSITKSSIQNVMDNITSNLNESQSKIINALNTLSTKNAQSGEETNQLRSAGNREQLINVVEDIKTGMSNDIEIEKFTEISRSIQGLQSLQQDSLSTEMYKGVMTDMGESFKDTQTSLFSTLSSKVGGLSEAIGNKISNVFNSQNIGTSMSEQVTKSEQIARSIRETADKPISKTELITQLEEMRDTLDNEEETEQFNNINNALNDIKSIEEEYLDPEVYRNILGDLFDNFSEKQSNIFQELLQEVGGLNEAMQSGVGRITGVIGDAFSPLSDVKEFTVGTFEALKGGFEKIMAIVAYMRSGNNQQEQQTGILGRMKNYMRELYETQADQLELSQAQYKRELRTAGGEKEGGIAGALGDWSELILTVAIPALSALAYVVGGLVGQIRVEFQNFYQTFIRPLTWFVNKLADIRFGRYAQSFVNVFTRIKSFFTNLGTWASVFSEWASMVKQGYATTTRIGKIFATVIDYLSSFASTLGRVGSALLRGMKILGWPLTMLFGLFDFVTAFVSEQGTLIDKIKAGLEEAIVGLVELPIRLIGWISDWILGIFGVKIEGGAGQAMLEGLKTLVGATIETILFPFKVIYKALSGLVSITINIGEFLGIFDGIKRAVTAVFDVIFSPFKILWDSLQLLWNFFTGDFSSVGSELSQIFGQIKGVIQSVFNVITWPFETFIIKPVTSLIGWFTGSPDTSAWMEMIGTVKSIVQSVFNVITWPFRTFIIDPIQSLINWITGSSIGNFVQSTMEGIKKVISSAVDFILFPFKMIYNSIYWLTSSIVDIGQFLGIFDAIKKTMTSVFDIILSPFKVLWDSLQLLWNFFTGDFSGVGSELSQIFGQIKGVIQSVFSVITWPFRTFIINPIQSLIGWFTGGDFGVGSFISETIDFLKGAFNKMGDLIINYTPIGWMYTGVSELLSWLSGGSSDGGFISTIIGYIKDMFSKFKNFVLDYTPIGWLYSGVKNLISWFFAGNTGDQSIFSWVIETLTQIPYKIGEWVANLIPSWDDIKSRVASIAKINPISWLIKGITSLVSSIGEWLANLIPSWDDLKGAVAGIAETINSWIPFIDPFSIDDVPNKPSSGKSGGNKEDKEVKGSKKVGGPIPETGLYQLHKGEYVVPQKDVEQISKTKEIDRIDREVAGMKNSSDGTQNYMKKLLEYQKQMLNRLEQNITAIKNLQQSNTKEQTQVTDTVTGAPREMKEPPDEIENIGIMLFNKNWGVT